MTQSHRAPETRHGLIDERVGKANAQVYRSRTCCAKSVVRPKPFHAVEFLPWQASTTLLQAQSAQRLTISFPKLRTQLESTIQDAGTDPTLENLCSVLSRDDLSLVSYQKAPHKSGDGNLSGTKTGLRDVQGFGLSIPSPLSHTTQTPHPKQPGPRFGARLRRIDVRPAGSEPFPPLSASRGAGVI